MANKSEKRVLNDQREALKSYLEALLEDEVEAYSPAQEQQAELAPEASTGDDNDVVAVNATSDRQQQPPPVSQANEETAEKIPANSQQTLTPAWAEYPFQVLTFEITGNLYAVPLKLLNGIVPMPEKITRVPTKITWFFGLFRNRGVNVKVLNIEKLWQTEAEAASVEDHGAGQQLILLIDEGRFGFLVNKVKTIMNLREDDVKWRQQAGCDGVLCGNIRSNMASLIDLSALSKGLNTGIWAGPR